VEKLSIDTVKSIRLYSIDSYGEKSNQGVQNKRSCNTCAHENSDMQCIHPDVNTKDFKHKKMSECYKKFKPVKTKNFDYMKKKAGRPKSCSIDI